MVHRQKKRIKKDTITLEELEKRWRKAFEDPEYHEYEDFNEFVQSYRDSGWTIIDDEGKIVE